MNALKARRKYDAEQQELAWKKRQEDEEARVAAMSDEERAAYEKEKSERRKRMFQTLGLMSAISGPYSDPKMWR